MEGLQHADHRRVPLSRSRVAALGSAALAILAALLATVLAAGCGGSTAATLDPVAQAAETTMHAGGAQMALDARIEGAALPSALTLHGQGSFNVSRDEGQMEISFQGLPQQVTQRLPGGTLQMTELFAHEAVYLKSPLLEGHLPNGAKWIKLDVTKLRSGLGIDTQSLSSGQADPAKILGYLRGHGASITEVGREDVRGTPTTHYRGTVDLAREAETLPATNRAALRSAMQAIVAKIGQHTLPLELWVDDHHLLRKLAFVISAAQGTNVSLTIELFGFGPAPSITAPPAKESYDITSSAVGSLLGG